MKLAIVYYTESGNTKQAAEYVAEGMKKAGAEVGLFELDKIDEAFVAEAKAVVFGAPTFYADTCWQMKKFFDETKLPLAGKIGATFGTAGYLQGGCEIALQNNVVRMLLQGHAGILGRLCTGRTADPSGRHCAGRSCGRAEGTVCHPG